MYRAKSNTQPPEPDNKGASLLRRTKKGVSNDLQAYTVADVCQQICLDTVHGEKLCLAEDERNSCKRHAVAMNSNRWTCWIVLWTS